MTSANGFFKTEFLITAIGTFVAIGEFFLGLFSTNTSLTDVYLFQLFFLFIISYISTVKRAGVLHVLSLLYLTTFVFAFGGIVATPFSDIYSFRDAHSPLEMKFSEEVVQKVILIYTVFTSATYLFYWGIIDYKKLWKREEVVLSTNSKYLTIAKYTMWITLPFAIYYSILQFNIVGSEGGRTALYSAGGNEALGVPLYVRIPNMFFTGAFYLLVASCPPKKVFIKYVLIYFITLIPILLMGERGEVIVPIIFTIWYMHTYFKIKINYLKLGILAFVIMAVAYILTFTRLGVDVGQLSGIIILFGFLETSATSFKLLGYYVTFKSKIADHTYPFVFDSLIAGLTGASGQSLETLNVRSSIGHQLVYYLNPNYYLAGASTGTSFVAECYEFGLLGVIIGALVLAMFIVYMDYRMRRSHYLMVFLYLLFSMIILSPRGGLFVGLYDIIKYSLILFVLTTIYSFFHPKRISK